MKPTPPTHEEIEIAAYYVWLHISLAGQPKSAEWNWLYGEKQMWDRYEALLKAWELEQ